MARKTVRSVMLMCVIILLIRDVYLLNCPTFPKYEAIIQGLLDDESMCRAKKYDLEAMICLNGLRPTGTFCATGSCNMFGFNCDGHCITGDDITDDEETVLSSFNCTMMALDLRENLCQKYKDELQSFKLTGVVELDKIVPFKSVDPKLGHFISLGMNMMALYKEWTTEERVKRVCSKTLDVKN